MPQQRKKSSSLKKRGGRARFILVAFALILWTSPALALRVLVVPPPAEDAQLFEAFGRLRAELLLQGFEVVLLGGESAKMSIEQLELAAKKENAFAAVALQREQQSTTARVQIVDRVTGKTVSRKLKINGTEDGPMLLAIRASDLLRTSLLELGPGERPPDDVVGTENAPPPEEVVRFSQPRRRFFVGAGALLLWHPELGASFGGTVSAGYRPVPRLSLGIDLGGPAFGGEFRVGENSASVREEFVLAKASYNLGSTARGARFEWGPVGRVGAVHIEASGHVAPPLVAQTNHLWALGVSGGAFGDFYLSDGINIGLQVQVLGLVPQPVVVIFEERSVPLGLQGAAALGVGVAF